MSPEVKTLVERLGIKVVSFKDIEHKKKLHLHYLATEAFYDIKGDYIAVNETLCKEPWQVDNAVLHEIAHWTGGSSRLNRQSLACYSSYQNYEENLAQSAAYEIACNLGLACDNIKKYTMHYCNKMYPIKRFEELLMTEDVNLVLHYVQVMSERKAA